MKTPSLLPLLLGLLLLQPARAAVVYATLAGQPDNFLRTGYPDRGFDFNGDGRNELVFHAEGLGTSIVTVDPQEFTDIHFYEGRGAAVLNHGDLINSSDTLFPGTNLIDHGWGTGGGAQLMSYFHAGGSGGPWSDRSGYLAFYFNDLDRAVSNFGWIRITDYGGVIEFHERAYETEDLKGIYAGQVPEPSCSACLLVAALVLTRRRRVA